MFLWNQVGEYAVAELQTAMEKKGLDMHVAALVSVHRFFILCQSSMLRHDLCVYVHLGLRAQELPGVCARSLPAPTTRTLCAR